MPARFCHLGSAPRASVRRRPYSHSCEGALLSGCSRMLSRRTAPGTALESLRHATCMRRRGLSAALRRPQSCASSGASSLRAPSSSSESRASVTYGGSLSELETASTCERSDVCARACHMAATCTQTLRSMMVGGRCAPTRSCTLHPSERSAHDLLVRMH